jgi:hypothetical protein
MVVLLCIILDYKNENKCKENAYAWNFGINIVFMNVRDIDKQFDGKYSRILNYL